MALGISDQQRELYIVLDGQVEAIAGGRSLRSMDRGELFGEIAFLNPDGRRTASPRAACRQRWADVMSLASLC